MTPESIIGAGALWLAIPLSMFAGLISFASPCVLPLVPGYLGFVGGSVNARPDHGSTTTLVRTDRRRLVIGVLLFILGFSVIFVALAALSGAVGGFFIQWGDLITRILGVVVIAMGLVFVGVFGFAQRELRLQVTPRAGMVGAPLLGIALGIGWAPCMGPTLAAIVSLSWNLGDPWRAALLGFTYALGLGIPFLLIALGFGWATRAVGFLRRHVRAINIFGGGMLIILGVLMVLGFWTQIMFELGAVMQTVILPL